MNFRPAAPEFKSGKDVHPLVDQQFGYAAPLLDLAGISTGFCGAITTQVLFQFVPFDLHARLCHAFLVLQLLLATLVEFLRISFYHLTLPEH